MATNRNWNEHTVKTSGKSLQEIRALGKNSREFPGEFTVVGDSVLPIRFDNVARVARAREARAKAQT